MRCLILQVSVNRLIFCLECSVLMEMSFSIPQIPIHLSGTSRLLSRDSGSHKMPVFLQSCDKKPRESATANPNRSVFPTFSSRDGGVADQRGFQLKCP